MFRLLRRLRRDERGQAMIIGAIAMLVLAVMVMTSVSIGHGVYSKIKLQDAADAQSYSIAVKEARAYNFLAYTNRAMVVHYSAMLTLTSYMSHALYLQETVGTAAKILKYIPGIGAIFAAIEQAIDAWVELVDALIKVIIPILTYINIGLWLAQEALLYATVLDIYTSSNSKPIQGTDPKAKHGYAMRQGSIFALLASFANWDMNSRNAFNFLNVVDDGPHSNGDAETKEMPSDITGMLNRKKLLNTSNDLKDPKMAKYRLLMGNIANGARKEWTARGKGPLLIGRRWKFDMCLVIGAIKIDKVADSQIKSFVQSGSENRKDQLFASDDIRIRVKFPCGGINKTVFKFDYKVRVAADNEEGFHETSADGREDENHPWKGITPFTLADPSYWSPWSYHFGYPCNAVFVTKDMIEARRVFALKTNFMEGKGSGKIENDGKLDMTWDEMADQQFTDMTGGMLAVSVGRAIYHRPGDWKEEPNFFNPLWTARLAAFNTHWQREALHRSIREQGNIPIEPKHLNY